MIEMRSAFDGLMKVYVAIHLVEDFNPMAADWMAEMRDNGSVTIDFGDDRGLRVYSVQEAVDYCRAEAILLETFLEYDHINLVAGTMRDAVQN